MSQKEVLADEVRDQARYIMERGKLIHEYVSHICTRHLTQDGKKHLYELSVPQWDAIKVIRKHDEMTITGLSDILGVSPPSASAMVERLVEKGILTRERSRKDRRRVVVRISAEIAEHIEKIENKILNSFAELVQELGTDLTQKWCEVLTRVQKILTAKNTL